MTSPGYFLELINTKLDANWNKDLIFNFSRKKGQKKKKCIFIIRKDSNFWNQILQVVAILVLIFKGYFLL